MIFTVLLAVHILLALLLISVILIQQGKGATAGAAFGSGASSTVFGPRGSASFLTRLTSILAVLFLSNCLLLAYLYSQTTKQVSLLDQVAGQSVPAIPQAPDVPSKIDIGDLVDKATEGKALDVPLPPAAATSAPTAVSAPAADVPAPQQAGAIQAPTASDGATTGK